MRLLNKIVVGASSVAFAAALVAGVNAPTASAEATNLSSKISVEFSTQSIKVTNDGDKKISVSFPTVKGTEISGEKNVCTYDMPTGGLTVDLSTLNVTKDNYVKVWGDKNTDPIIIKIPAADQLGKAKVEFDKDDVATATVPKKKETAAYGKGIEYAVGSGNWTTNTNGTLKVSDYTALGATLRVRVAGATTIAAGANALGTAKEYSIKKSDKKAKVYELTGTFPGKEIKVKVPKKAAAPKVKVDYTKGTVTLPKDAQYRVNTFGENGAVSDLGTWTAGSGKVLKQGEGLGIVTGGAIDVRTKKEGKPASMYLAFSYDKQATLTVTKVSPSDDPKNNAAEATVKTDAKDAPNDLTLTYARTIVTGKRASTSGAITVKNTSKDFAYEYLLVKDGDGKDPAADVKGAKSVKSGKDAKIKLKNDAKYTIYVRRAAVSKGDVAWATPWVKAIELTKTDLVPSVGK